MTRLWMGLALGLGIAACGSGTAPFGGEATTTETDGTGDGTATGAIPDVLAGNIDSFTYDPTNQTLSLVGKQGSNSVSGTYRRRPALDRVGYEAYTAQDASNGRHVTVYVKDIEGTRAAVAATGVQFEAIYAGGAYSNTSYSARVVPDSTDPDRGLVYYTGRYVGLLNIGDPSPDDLTTPNAGEDPSVSTQQASETTGDMQITADFATSNVEGIIYNRTSLDFANPADPTTPAPLVDVALDGTTIATDGTFAGTATQSDTSVGDYGGIFGGTGATAVAGVVHLENHIDGFTNEEEFGVFVLGECAPPNSGPDCNLTP